MIQLDMQNWGIPVDCSCPCEGMMSFLAEGRSREQRAVLGTGREAGTEYTEMPYVPEVQIVL